MKTASSLKRMGLAAVALSLILAATAGAQGGKLKEYQIKAGFLYNFAKLTIWPATAFAESDTPLVLCIASEHPFSDLFAQLLEGKSVGKRKLVVKKGFPSASKAPADGPIGDETIASSPPDCHILFIGSSDPAFIREKLRAVQGQPVLTVGETQGFCLMGGIVNFFTQNNQLRFQVYLDHARRAGIKLRSQLLMSAVIIERH